MSDFKADVKIEFDFMGKNYQYDGWINYSPDTDGVDDRIREFFSNSYEDGLIRYENVKQKALKRQNKEKVDLEEKETLRILKEKYPNS